LDDDARHRRALELAHTALRHYALPDAQPVFMHHNGGLTYRVEAPRSGHTFLLKIHAPVGVGAMSPTAADLEARLHWLAVLHQHTDLIVQAPILNQAGGWITWASDPQLSAPVLCSLQQWVDGEPPRGDFTLQQLANIGRLLATFHTAGRQYRDLWSAALPEFDPPDIAEWVRSLQAGVDLGLLTADQFAAIAATGPSLHHALAYLAATPDHWGPIHGDVHHANLVFHQGEARLIDFDNLQLAPYVLDLGTILYHIHYQGAGACRTLLAGYQQLHASQPVIGTELDLALLYAAMGNLAFQITIPDQWPTVALARNLRQLAEEFCRPFLAGESILAS
jgi:Ser/Thr protein kinase RdoA (MazF antagonist)